MLAKFRRFAPLSSGDVGARCERISPKSPPPPPQSSQTGLPRVFSAKASVFVCSDIDLPSSVSRRIGRGGGAIVRREKIYCEVFVTRVNNDREDSELGESFEMLLEEWNPV